MLSMLRIRKCLSLSILGMCLYTYTYLTSNTNINMVTLQQQHQMRSLHKGLHPHPHHHHDNLQLQEKLRARFAASGRNNEEHLQLQEYDDKTDILSSSRRHTRTSMYINNHDDMFDVAALHDDQAFAEAEQNLKTAALVASAAAAAPDEDDSTDTDTHHYASNSTNFNPQFPLPGRHPIFYNWFVPAEKPRNAVRIAAEQIAERNRLAVTAPVYVTLIHKEQLNETTPLSKIKCQPPCHLRDHLNVGNEVDTHQALWEYCRDDTVVGREEEYVTYLHDKGSFHSTMANEHARRVATVAVLQCRKLLLQAAAQWRRFQYNDENGSNDKLQQQQQQLSHQQRRKLHLANRCSACGTTFNVLPQFQMNANMWTLQCSYVRQLYEPKKYATAMETMYRATLRHKLHQNTTYACLQPRNWTHMNHVGLGRYAAERWALSHPHVMPCSSLPHQLNMNKINSWDTPQAWEPVLTREPRRPAMATGLNSGKFGSAFARLEGRLHEWRHVYNATPAKHSWIYKYYGKRFVTNSPNERTKCEAIRQATLRGDNEPMMVVNSTRAETASVVVVEEEDDDDDNAAGEDGGERR